MRRTRPGMSNRYSHKRGSWMSKDAGHYAQADRDYKPAVITLPEKVAHPVVKAPQHKCYRVIRLYVMSDGYLSFEDIGYGTEREAMDILGSEKWRAQVLNPDGCHHADNWLSMEKR